MLVIIIMIMMVMMSVHPLWVEGHNSVGRGYTRDVNIVLNQIAVWVQELS